MRVLYLRVKNNALWIKAHTCENKFKASKVNKYCMCVSLVSSVVRALVLQTRGREFKSLTGLQSFFLFQLMHKLYHNQFIYSSIVRSFSSQFVRSLIYSASNLLYSSCLWVRLAFAQVFIFIISLLCIWRVQECFLFKRNAFKFLTHVQSKTSQLKTVGKTLARFNTQFEKGVFHFFAMKVKNTLR